MRNVAFNTVLKFIPEIGEACDKYQDKVFHNLECKKFNAMKYGPSVMLKKRRTRESIKANLAMRMFGPGL